MMTLITIYLAALLCLLPQNKKGTYADRGQGLGSLGASAVRLEGSLRVAVMGIHAVRKNLNLMACRAFALPEYMYHFVFGWI